ncbi:kinase-like domain-containing protein [Xylaria curta]|nr:kinase-like domain-containing protein [Xylaria curta]
MEDPVSSSLDSLRNELLMARRFSSWSGKTTTFFAEKDVSRLTSKKIIERVVLEDNNIELSQKTKFIDHVYENACKLFLMFIYSGLPIHLLKDIGYTDNDFPLSIDLSLRLPIGLYDIELENLISTNQWKFTVPELSWTGGHTKFHPDSIPPITSMVQIGSGSSATVYKIEIDSNYIAEGTQQPFALKVIPPLFSVKEKVKKMKERELLNALRRLGQEHIIKLCASFEYLGQFCMIFPLATCDLNRYMDQEPPGNNPKYVSWLIRQLQGLIDALSRIHGTDVQEPDSVRHETGCHHGLKPGNILFFQDSAESEMYGTLQIADFGLAKFHSDTTNTERSRTRSAILGTPRYAPPEFLLGGRTNASASYDLWSFGCIILELLIWNQFGREGREGFLQREDRLFYRTAQTNFEIHDYVRAWIERLECSDLHPSLKKLLEVTENKLLVWDPDGRWTSAELLNFFSTLEETEN